LRQIAEKTQQFEWYSRYEAFAGVLGNHMGTGARVLQVGCGNSPFAADMVAAGHVGEIVNVDISATVVELQAKVYNSLPATVSWHVGDCMALPNSAPFIEASFDVILDKGTADALMCGGDTTANVAAMRHEANRMLRKRPVSGTTTAPCFISITYGDPKSRVRWFSGTEEDWDVCVYAVEKALPHKALGPVQVSGTDDWQDKTRAWESDVYHYVYVCRVRMNQQSVM